MDLGLKDRVALIAGASKGLGYATAMQLSLEGAKVAICARDADALEEAARKIGTASGNEVISVPCDVTDPEQLDGFIDSALGEWGSIDIAVTNAGGPAPGTFETLSAPDWDTAVALTLKPVLHTIDRVLPMMKESQWGRILNMTSISVKQPVPNLMLSNSIRAAVIGMAKTLSFEVAQYGVTVNNIAPGYFETERLGALIENTATSQNTAVETVRERFLAQVPAMRLGSPNEFADFATFLCSERASYITGATFQIDGGLYKGFA